MTSPMTINDALALAVEAHRGQWDKGRPALPYVTHPIRVMQRFDDPELQMIAVLHDSVEDSEGVVTLASLRDCGASARVLSGIEAMTHLADEPDEVYWAQLRQNEDARTVKLADIDDNSDPARLALLPAEQAARFTAKYRKARSAIE